MQMARKVVTQIYGTHFNPEDRGKIFIRNLGAHPQVYSASSEETTFWTQRRKTSKLMQMCSLFEINYTSKIKTFTKQMNPPSFEVEVPLCFTFGLFRYSKSKRAWHSCWIQQFDWFAYRWEFPALHIMSNPLYFHRELLEDVIKTFISTPFHIVGNSFHVY
jgi:hypothetical protein